MTDVSSIISHATLVAATSKSSGGSSLWFPIILVGFFALYFLYLRPQRNRLRQQQAQQRNFEVGDEVVTTSGIVGIVRSIDGDRVDLETGNGTTMTLLRSAIARRVDPPAPESDLPPDDRPPSGDATNSGNGEPWWPKGGEEEPPADGGGKP